jgi:hypothetical protein
MLILRTLRWSQGGGAVSHGRGTPVPQTRELNLRFEKTKSRQGELDLAEGLL